MIVCKSAYGKGNLHFCDGRIDAEKYIVMLEKYFGTSWDVCRANETDTWNTFITCYRLWQKYYVLL